jgi:hypothetical protein
MQYKSRIHGAPPDDMSSPPDWNLLQALFEKALRQPSADRAAFLRSHTDNEAIRLEVESLLAAHQQAGGFMEASGLLSENDSRGDEPRFASGSRLGAFEILERLGAGGMGEVYRARDTRLDRFVAIKVLSPELDMTAHGRHRFEREARAISKLSHSHICTVHDIGEARVDGRDIPFLVLERRHVPVLHLESNRPLRNLEDPGFRWWRGHASDTRRWRGSARVSGWTVSLLHESAQRDEQSMADGDCRRRAGASVGGRRPAGLPGPGSRDLLPSTGRDTRTARHGIACWRRRVAV